MSDLPPPPTAPAAPLPARRLAPPTPPLPHRARGGRTILAVLALIAVFGTLLYLLRDPARRQLARINAAVIQPAAPAPPDQLAALTTEMAQLRQRVATLEAKAAAAPTPARPAPAPVAMPLAPGSDALVTALSARMDGLSAQLASVASTLKADEVRLEAAGNQADEVSAMAERLAQLGRVTAATAAIANGQKLGDMPNMPPALARYRDAAPPTEAQLRLAFAPVAARARAAARPDSDKLGFWRAMRARAEALITVRRGDTVLVGSSQVGILDTARAALDAGDLAGAVRILGGLQGAAAAAVADWRAQAQALLDARAALGKLASQS